MTTTNSKSDGSTLLDDEVDSSECLSPEVVEELLDDVIPAEKRDTPEVLQIKRLLAVRGSTVSVQSPFLPPEFISGYNQASPGLGDKLVEATLRQQEHKMQMNERQMTRLENADSFEREEFTHMRLERTKEYSLKSVGQILSFVLSLCLICLAGYAIFNDHPWIAGISLGCIASVIAKLFLQKDTPEEKTAVEDNSSSTTDKERKDQE